MAALARRQTLELQRANNYNTHSPKNLQTSFANQEYNLDTIILPNTPLSTEERGGSNHPSQSTLGSNHEYAEVDQAFMNKNKKLSSRGKMPIPDDRPEKHLYLNLVTDDSNKSTEYETCYRDDSRRVVPVPMATPPDRRYADINRGSRAYRPPTELYRNSTTEGYVRASKDDCEGVSDRRSKTEGYFLARDVMERQK